MLFQELFANPTLTIVHIAEFIGLLMLLLFGLRHDWYRYIRRSDQNRTSHLGITNTGFEISLGKLRLAGFRRTAKLPIEALTRFEGEKQR